MTISSSPLDDYAKITRRRAGIAIVILAALLVADIASVIVLFWY